MAVFACVSHFIRNPFDKAADVMSQKRKRSDQLVPIMKKSTLSCSNCSNMILTYSVAGSVT